MNKVSFWVWLAFWGNMFTAFSVYQILSMVRAEQPDETRQDPDFFERWKLLGMQGRPWYYVVPMLVYATWQTMRALQPFIYKLESVDWQSSISQFFGGCMLLGVFVYYRWGQGKTYTADQIRAMLYQIAIAFLLALSIMFALALRSSGGRVELIEARVEKTEATGRRNAGAVKRLEKQVNNIDTTR